MPIVFGQLQSYHSRAECRQMLRKISKLCLKDGLQPQRTRDSNLCHERGKYFRLCSCSVTINAVTNRTDGIRLPSSVPCQSAPGKSAVDSLFYQKSSAYASANRNFRKVRHCLAVGFEQVRLMQVFAIRANAFSNREQSGKIYFHSRVYQFILALLDLSKLTSKC